MHLEAVRIGSRLAVIADGDRQEMILDIRLLQPRRGTQEGAGFELVGSAEAALGKQPLCTSDTLPEPWQPGIERHRLGRDLLEIEFHMVLQIGADARPIDLYLNAHVL